LGELRRIVLDQFFARELKLDEVERLLTPLKMLFYGLEFCPVFREYVLPLPLCKVMMEGVKIRISHDLGDDRAFQFTDTDLLVVMCNARMQVLEARMPLRGGGWSRGSAHGIHHKSD
jgi:hypothetical protein